MVLHVFTIKYRVFQFYDRWMLFGSMISSHIINAIDSEAIYYNASRDDMKPKIFFEVGLFQCDLPGSSTWPREWPVLVFASINHRCAWKLESILSKK